MAIPLSEVKSVCTGSELALVRASRGPGLAKLSLAETKQHAQRARKLLDKWRGQSRGQARKESRAVGFPNLDTRTTLKVSIFEEALQTFEAHVAELEAAGARPSLKPAGGTPKTVRVAGHRKTRALVRSALAETEAALGSTRRAPRKAAAKPVAKATAKAESSAPAEAAADGATTTKPARKIKPAPKTPAKKKAAKKRRPAPVAEVVHKKPKISKSKQRSATTAAKKSRVVRSGLTTRVRGHVSAHGKRAQSRRDNRK